MTDLSQLTTDFKESQVSYAALFGSRANDTAKSDSDYDFLIEFEPDKRYTLVDLSSLKSSLEDKLQANVDLVTTKSIHPYLRKSVLSTAQVIYDDRS